MSWEGAGEGTLWLAGLGDVAHLSWWSFVTCGGVSGTRYAAGEPVVFYTQFPGYLGHSLVFSWKRLLLSSRTAVARSLGNTCMVRKGNV